MMLMVILCSKKVFFVYYRSKFYKYDTFPEEVTFKLVAQGNNVENGKKKVWFFPLTSSILLFKNVDFSFHVLGTYHFDSKIIVSLSIDFHSIQHFLSMINNFHLLKLRISSKNTQCFKTNILTLIKPE